MDKYKICPSCQTKNEPTRFECISCEADLTGVKIMDEATEKMDVAKEEKVEEATHTCRMCECGAKNPPNARKCSACNRDISFTKPTPDTENAQEKKKTKYVLSSLDGKYVYAVSSEETVVGKENVMCEYLGSKAYVSRTQAKLTIENEKLYIENLSQTNGTFVNNEKITKKVELKKGDKIGFGGKIIGNKRQSEAAYFLVKEV